LRRSLGLGYLAAGAGTVLSRPHAERVGQFVCFAPKEPGGGRGKESFLDPAPAVPLLVRAMNDRDPRVVAEAATSLGRLAVRADLSVPALANKLSSPTAEVRAAAASALGGFQGQGHAAVPSLVRALSDRNLSVRVAVSNALDAVAPEVLTAQSR